MSHPRPSTTSASAAPAHAPWTPSRSWCLAALALILLAGAALRTLDLEHTPYGIWFDEAINGMDALHVWQPGGHFKMYYSVDIGFPHEPMFQTGLNLVVGVFGNSVVAVRAYSAALGLLTILLVYLFARRWLGEAEGLAAAGVLATLRWHALFSRLSFRTLILGPWMLGLVWAALAYDRKRTPGRLALLGLFIGGGFYTYLSWWFLLPVVAFAVGWLFWDSMHTPQGKRHLALLALVTALAYLPMGIFTVRHPDIVTKRAGAVSLFSGSIEDGLHEIFKNTGEALLMFHVWGDHVPVQNISGPGWLAAHLFNNFPTDPNRGTPFIGHPALDPLQGIFFIIGLVLAVRWWRSERRFLSLLLLGWLFFGWLSTVLTKTDSPNFLRTLCITPVVALLTGAALAAAGRGVARRWGAGAGVALVALALLYSGAQAGWDIYGVWGRRADVWRGFHGDLTDLARTAAAAPADAAVMFPAELLEHPAVQFQTFGHKNIYPYASWPDLLGPWPPSPAAKAGGQAAPRKRWIFVTAANGLIRPLRDMVPQALAIRGFNTPEGNTWAALISVPEEHLPVPATLQSIQSLWKREMTH